MTRGARTLAAALVGTFVAAFATLAVVILFFFATMAPGMPANGWLYVLAGGVLLTFGVTFAVVFREMLEKFTR